MSSGFDLTGIGGFDWDMGNLDHIKKHNVTQKECEEAFFSKPLLINNDESHSQTEERYRAYAMTKKKRLLVVVFTVRNNKIRVISARDQSGKEKKEFQDKISIL